MGRLCVARALKNFGVFSMGFAERKNPFRGILAVLRGLRCGTRSRRRAARAVADLPSANLAKSGIPLRS
jgi:hypothetical protein